MKKEPTKTVLVALDIRYQNKLIYVSVSMSVIHHHSIQSSIAFCTMALGIIVKQARLRRVAGKLDIVNHVRLLCICRALAHLS